jgi:phosphoribosylanthranilate isomerase
MRRTRVKICGITRLEDALAAVAAGADALGFVFHPASPRYIPPAAAAEIIDRLPPFVASVGLFVDLEPAAVNDAVAVAKVDLVQFHGQESPATCALSPRPWIKAIQVRAGLDFEAIAGQYAGARALLVDAWHPTLAGGTGHRFDWNLIAGARTYPLVLAGGLDAANVAQAIQQVSPYAVDVSGGVESSKGIKDIAKIREFIAEVSQSERQA